MPALPTFLNSLIDYAGLFPPAKLPMADAVRNYAAYRHGPHAGSLGRFILPLARLSEFEPEFARLHASIQSGWQLSALAGPDPAADIATILSFHARQSRARIISIETKASTPAEIPRVIAPFPSDLEVWVELPASTDPAASLAALKTSGRSAKLRTGGVTPDAFPSASDILRFLTACRDAGVAFKATAGLHHPLRADHALTYETGSPRAVMFGFLNIFLGATLLHSGGPATDALALLEDTQPGNFSCAPDAITWRQHRFSVAALAAARNNFCRSFGSCSFTEPIEGLQALHWL